MNQSNHKNECEKWLKNLFENHKCLIISYVVSLAKIEGFKKSDLKVAKKAIGLKTKYYPADIEKGSSEHWAWEI